MNIRPLWSATVALFLLGSCGEDVALGGSIDASYDLRFDRLVLRKQENYLLVEYIRDAANGIEKICKVVVDFEGLDPHDGLSLEDEEFLAHVTVQRAALSGGDFPPVEEGTIGFDRLDFSDGGEIKGEFDTLFAAGRTLYGSFEGELTLVQEPGE